MRILTRLAPGHYNVSNGKDVIGSVFRTRDGVWKYWHNRTSNWARGPFASRQGALDALVVTEMKHRCSGANEAG